MQKLHKINYCEHIAYLMSNVPVSQCDEWMTCLAIGKQHTI